MMAQISQQIGSHKRPRAHGALARHPSEEACVNLAVREPLGPAPHGLQVREGASACRKPVACTEGGL